MKAKSFLQDVELEERVEADRIGEAWLRGAQVTPLLAIDLNWHREVRQ